jgi:hypothetical protein
MLISLRFLDKPTESAAAHAVLGDGDCLPPARGLAGDYIEFAAV